MACNAQALGACSEAEGSNTVASGASSHAEGLNTSASVTASHAEGYLTQSAGSASHAEGGGAIASGLYFSLQKDNYREPKERTPTRKGLIL